jgi:polar amino acid transport system substrate-binding protein
MLAHGRIDVLPGDHGRILNSAALAGLADEIREVKPPVEMTPGYLAFTKIRDLTGVAQSFNYALRSMKSDGTYAAILKKYPTP